MWIGHRKEIQKLMFHELALRRSESAPNYLVILPTNTAHSFFRNVPPSIHVFQVKFSDFVITKRDTRTNDVKRRFLARTKYENHRILFAFLLHSTVYY